MLKVDRKQIKQDNVNEHTMKHIKDEYDLRNNEVDKNGDVIPLFITQIKERFHSIDRKFEMIQMSIDQLSKEFQAKEK